MNAIVLLTTNAALLVALFVLLWLVCLKTRDVTPIDSVWALGMVFLAAASFGVAFLVELFLLLGS